MNYSDWSEIARSSAPILWPAPCSTRPRKGAIETLTKGLALELAPRKIRVNAISPGHTETEGNMAAGTFEGGAGAVLAEKTPLGRLGRG